MVVLLEARLRFLRGSRSVPQGPPLTATRPSQRTFGARSELHACCVASGTPAGSSPSHGRPSAVTATSQHTRAERGTWLALRATTASVRGAKGFILLTDVGRGRRFVENRVAACRFRFLVGAGGGGAQRHHHSGKDHRTVVCFAALESHGCGGGCPV